MTLQKSKSQTLSTLGLNVMAVLLLGAGQQAAGQSADENQALQEVVVTAQKREESLQKVPISISALTQTQLDHLKLDDPSGLATLIPNLQVNGIVGESAPVFSLRGVSMFDYSFNQSSPVVPYVDEVSKGNFALFGVEMFDLARVEVLRGPQGTLYGKNTTGGAINFITRRPTFDNEAYVNAGVGNFNRREVEGALNGTLAEERIAARLAFSYTKADGWFKGVNGSPDMNAVDQYGVRLGILFRANEELSFLLRYTRSEHDVLPHGVKAVPGPAGIGGGLYALFNAIDPALNPRSDDFRTGLDDDEIETSYHPSRKQTTDGVSLTVKWSLSEDSELTSISSWDKGKLFVGEDTDGSPLRVAEIPYLGRTEQWAQDLRISSNGDSPFAYIVGAYFNREKIFNSTELRLYNDLDINLDGALDYRDCLEGLTAGLGGAGCRFGNAFHQDRKSWALYTDTSYKVSEPLKLRLGLRYTTDKGDQTRFVAQLRGNDGVVLANLIPGDPNDLDATASRSLENKKVTGRVGFDYSLPGNHLLYLSYSRGYRSGAFNAQAFFSPDELTVVKPESISSCELGVKTQWLEGRLQANASVFLLDYKNQQIIDVDPITLAQPLKNLDKSTIKGGELEIIARPVPALTLHAALGVLDAKLKKATLRGEDLSGNDLPNAPTTTASLSTQWDMAHWGQRSGLTLFLDASYAASQYFEPFNIERLKQGGYTLIDASAVFHVNDQFDVAAWGRNLTDKFYITSAADLSGFGFDYTHRGVPRTYGLEASYRL
jgi:iron complex outermembrane receptor protein